MRTGINGKEHHVIWTVRTAPTPPKMRALAGDHHVTLFWDNLSETVPDLMNGRMDFEGYQIWRADDWHRPIGTSERTGPDLSLWSMIAIRDLVNGLMPDEEFRYPVEAGGWLYEPLAGFPYREEMIDMFESRLAINPADPVPCPPEVDAAVCDTIEGLARSNLQLEGGKRYYTFTDRTAKNGMHYFYSVVPYDHVTRSGQPVEIGLQSSPSANFVYIHPRSEAQPPGSFDEKEVYVVPNPVTAESMEPWELGPSNADPTGLKCEFRNLPGCRNIIRIYTVSGDLVQVLHHDGRKGDGTMPWNLTSRNGQEVTSGVFIFAVEPADGRFKEFVGKFVVIR
jgi:hypothetical protein